MDSELLAASFAKTTELFYFLSFLLMWLIHAGFMVYEGGMCRQKNVLMTMVKNLMVLGVCTFGFYFWGWWIYWAFRHGFWPIAFTEAVDALPWADAMGPNLQDHITGVFWGAFLLFAFTTASIMSGACIERIKLGGFAILAVVLGTVAWMICASWGWSDFGWLYQQFAFHDWGCGGVIHVCAGAFTLGVLLNLGPRIGRYNKDGTTNAINPHNLPLTMLGLMMIFTGFYAFYMGCLVYNSGAAFHDASIYLTPSTLSSIVFVAMSGFSGGLLGAFIFSKGDPFWTICGGLVGMIAIASGLDFYHPMLGAIIGFLGSGVAILTDKLVVDVLGIDDAVGAVGVHGGTGVWACIATGIFASGYPGVNGLQTSFYGQLVGVVTMALVGFLFGYWSSWILKKLNALRSSTADELVGLDLAEIGLEAYPEMVMKPEIQDTSKWLL
jgi:ammonia channel protein AmtB